MSFLDTAGAYPGIEAEERGQGWAIAEALSTLAEVRAPVVVVGIGEGGSGGALAIGFGDRIIMLENSYYSVISPEGCASILYKDSGRASDAAACLRMGAQDLLELGIVDEVIPEPLGGAHHDADAHVRSGRAWRCARRWTRSGRWVATSSSAIATSGCGRSETSTCAEASG